MKRLIATLAALIVSGTFTAAPAQAESAAADRNPVIYVHGFGGSATEFDNIKPAFRDAGYTDSQLYALDFNNTQNNQTTAKQLSTKVDEILSRTGASKVDIFAFSMGSLSSRYYIKNLGGTAKVGHWFSVAGPNHGTSQASWCWVIGDWTCYQMAPNSSFLRELNSGDESPGDVKYFTTISNCDDVIDPRNSTAITGATNTRTADCLKHNQTPGNANVLREIIAAYGT